MVSELAKRDPKAWLATNTEFQIASGPNRYFKVGAAAVYDEPPDSLEYASSRCLYIAVVASTRTLPWSHPTT